MSSVPSRPAAAEARLPGGRRRQLGGRGLEVHDARLAHPPRTRARARVRPLASRRGLRDHLERPDREARGRSGARTPPLPDRRRGGGPQHPGGVGRRPDGAAVEALDREPGDRAGLPDGPDPPRHRPPAPRTRLHRREADRQRSCGRSWGSSAAREDAVATGLAATARLIEEEVRRVGGGACEPLPAKLRLPFRWGRATMKSMSGRKTSGGGRGVEVEGLNPDVLKWARERAGHSVPEVARKLS